MMSKSLKFVFAEAASYYKFRAPYADAALDYVTSVLDLGAASRVLDLGCGPGSLALPLSQRVGSVLAVDPCHAMIDEGQARAVEAGRDNIDWLCTRAEEIRESDIGTFSLAIIGQAFHWMDRDLVLHKLTQLLDPQTGALVLINPGKRRPQESWEPTTSEVIARYLGKPQRHESMNPELEHEPALRRSKRFAEFTAREFSTHVQRDIRAIIGHTYSLSTSPRSAFRQRVHDFENDLTESLLALNPSGIFHERVETEVILARMRGSAADHACDPPN